MFFVGRVSGAVYYGNEGELNDLIVDAFKTFSVSNPLHPDVFPGIRAMESQVVSMVLNMLVFFLFYIDSF